MAKAKGKHVSDKAQYNAYETLCKRSKNRKAKLARHLKNHPEDAQAVDASKIDGKQKVKPYVKGHFPDAKDNTLRTTSGSVIEMGLFEPYKKEGKK